jgi:uncharacterized delta-60 repeat protein
MKRTKKSEHMKTRIHILCLLLCASAAFCLHGVVQAQPGTLDLTFNGNGYTVTSFQTCFSYAMATCVDPDGKIISAAYQWDTTLHPPMSKLMVIRYNADGSIDQGFGTGGMVTADFASQSLAAALQSDGKIVVAGLSKTGSQTVSRMTLFRLNNDGSFDQAFGQGGMAQDSLGRWSSSVAVLADGRILAAGVGYTSGTPSYSFHMLAMHHADGTMDTTFGNAGVVTTMIPNCTGAYILGVVVQPDGKILLGDEVKLGRSCMAMMRYNPDGSPDAGFGSNGLVIDSAGLRNGCYKLAVQPDGRILVPAYIYPDDLNHSHYSLFRYLPDGRRDSTFHNSGMEIGEGGAAYDIVLQPDGKILTCGNLMNDSTIKHAVVKRYLSSGEPDFSFGTNGIADLNIEPPSGLLGLALCPDGKIAAAGYCNEAVSPSPTWRNTLTLRLNSFAVGISESGPGQIVRISPNPFVDFITVETPGLNGSIIEVHSIQGQMIELLKMEGEKGTFNLGHLPAGSYLLKTITGGNRQSVPMIKIK